jgi:hypothetical protein
VCMSNMFLLRRWVCGKEIKTSEIEGMKAFTIRTMCNLEKVFPPAFFDVQEHLVSHLVQEVEVAGPVHARCMYWVERYLKVLKSYVRQHAKPEGCMVAGYLQHESLFHASGAMELFDPQAPTSWEEVEDFKGSGCRFLGAKTRRTLTAVEQEQIKSHVLHNDKKMEPWVEQYKQLERRARDSNHGILPRGFIPYSEWLEKKVDNLIDKDGDDAVALEVREILRGMSLHYISTN